MTLKKSVLFSLIILVLLSGCSASHQEIIAERGQEVMPFDLDKTMHMFASLDDGGLQTVEAKDPNDTEQIQLIQAHLQEEAERFQQGDFADPAHIHGEDMAGLHTLTTRADEIEIVYTPLENGGQIRYTTTDPELITAIHDWFEAQLSDHGAHASESH